jgi:hypothetical protein
MRLRHAIPSSCGFQDAGLLLSFDGHPRQQRQNIANRHCRLPGLSRAAVTATFLLVQGQSMATTACINGQVIDGRGKAYQGYVIVDGDQIAEVEPGSEPHLGNSVVRKELTSKSILPGLIDCHVHLRNDGVADPRAQAAADTDAVAVLRSARNASESCKTRAVF